MDNGRIGRMLPPPDVGGYPGAVSGGAAVRQMKLISIATKKMLIVGCQNSANLLPNSGRSKLGSSPMLRAMMATAQPRRRGPLLAGQSRKNAPQAPSAGARMT